MPINSSVSLSAPEAVLPERALCLPTFSHFLIFNKTSLSLSLSLSPPPPLPPSRARALSLPRSLSPCCSFLLRSLFTFDALRFKLLPAPCSCSSSSSSWFSYTNTLSPFRKETRCVPVPTKEGAGRHGACCVKRDLMCQKRPRWWLLQSCSEDQLIAHTSTATGLRVTALRR